MKRVVQRRGVDCGIACVAMLANVSYEVAKKRMFGDRPVRRTSKECLQDGLRHFGIRTATRLVRCGANYTTLNFRAILKTNATGDGNWHWIVWDADRKRILDPLEKPYKNPRVVSYLRVYG